MSVWDCFIQKGHSKPNEPFVPYLCKICGKEISVQMAGVQDIRERSFVDQAFFKLADHLADHISHKGGMTNHAIDLKVRERIARKQFIKEAVSAKVCPQCGSDIQIESEDLGHGRGGLLIWCCKDAACDFKIKATDL